MRTDPNHQSDKPARPLAFSDRARWVSLLTILLALVAAACFVYAYSRNFGGVLSSDHEVWAQAGDFFSGTLGVVLVFLTLVLVAFSLWQSSTVVRLTQAMYEEARVQAIEARRQAESAQAALSNQIAAQERQVLQTSVLSLIDAKEKALNSIQFIGRNPNPHNNNTVVLRGRDAVARILEKLPKQFAQRFASQQKPLSTGPEAHANLSKFFRDHTATNELHYYYSTVMAARQLFDAQNLKVGNNLVDIYVSTVSPSEYVLIDLYAIAENGHPKSIAYTAWLGSKKYTSSPQFSAIYGFIKS
ncbi:MAG: hypothetical protein AAF270_06905 [Pseudomonadota bacterium]